MQTESGLSHCPRCDHELPADPRYVTWCDRCDWNVDPHPEHHKVAAWQQRQQLSVYREWERGAVNRPGSPLARASAYLVTLPVLLIPCAGLLGAVALLLFYRPLWFSALLAVVALVIGAAFRPRPQELPSDARPVSRAEAPGLYAVLDAVGPVSGVYVHSGPTVNAARITWRFRRVLVIGTSYWSALEPQERVAVIALSLARSGRLASAIAAARRVLTGLIDSFRPGPLDEARHDEAQRVLPSPADGVVSAQDDVIVNYYLTKLANLLFGPLLRLYLAAFQRVTLRFTQYDAYAADSHAAQLAGTTATAAALEKALLSDTAFRALERALRYNRDVDPTTAACRAVAEVPRRELERRVRLTRLCCSPDHPPTYLRLRLLQHSPAQPQVTHSTDLNQELAHATTEALAAFRREL
ncbi:hypothetical protein [Kribbella sp. NPDC051770]|uniref:hypothetical protein n=1 Tax=Kribbella sp. NPDC051770 TaxID=3155413 RepID=UPI003415E0E8